MYCSDRDLAGEKQAPKISNVCRRKKEKKSCLSASEHEGLEKSLTSIKLRGPVCKPLFRIACGASIEKKKANKEGFGLFVRCPGGVRGKKNTVTTQIVVTRIKKSISLHFLWTPWIPVIY
jgi:hypothetical protein